MKPGDLVTVIRSSYFSGKTAIVLCVLPSNGIFVKSVSCLIDGRVTSLPSSWLKVIDEVG